MNPFSYGVVVTGNEFCPRPGLVEELSSHIISAKNVALHGQRRTGKTSLITETVRSMPGHSLLYIDLLAVKTIDDVCRRLANGMLSMERKEGFLEKIMGKLVLLRPQLTMDPISGQPSLSFDLDKSKLPESLQSLIDLLPSFIDNGPVVVCMDEFQDLRGISGGDEALALLRSRIQFHTELPYVFAGSIFREMHMIFHDPASPLYKSALTMEVGPLNDAEFITYLTERFQRGRRRVIPELWKEIFSITDRNPSDVQQFCSALWSVTNTDDMIDHHTLKTALKMIHAHERKGYESLLTLLSDQQQRCLIGVANHGGKHPLAAQFLDATGIKQPTSVKRALTSLCKKRILTRDNREYRFANPFFSTWLRGAGL